MSTMRDVARVAGVSAKTVSRVMNNDRYVSDEVRARVLKAVEQHVFLDRVLTVIATVEQTFWELVFSNENLKVAQAALKAAEARRQPACP